MSSTSQCEAPPGSLSRISHRRRWIILTDSWLSIQDQATQINTFAAQLMVQQSRADNIMVRYDGDEFAILLVETPKSGASCFAERIRQVLADCAFNHARQITASFGITSLPDENPTSSEALIRAADEALYATKRGGKNSVASDEPERTCAQA